MSLTCILWQIAKLQMEPKCLKCYFLPNLLIVQISEGVTLHKAGKACQGQTLSLIGAICNSSRKWSVVGWNSQNFFFFVTCELDQ